MPFDPNKTVSIEEYNETLSSTYAMTYEHMKNDPTLSREEFIQQASAMSEKYHDAIQDFQNAQDAKAEANVSVTDGIRSAEANGILSDVNTEDMEEVSVTNTGIVESEASGGGIGDESSGDAGIDNDSDGVDDGMDI